MNREAALERVTGVEPVFRPWQGRIIPLYDTRALVTIAKTRHHDKATRLVSAVPSGRIDPFGHVAKW